MLIEEARAKIDAIDMEFLHLLGKRMELSLIIGRLKLETEDLSREKIVLKRAEQSMHIGVDADFAKKLFKQIIEESKRLQKNDRKHMTTHHSVI